MSNYYKQKKRAFIRIQKMIDSARETGIELSIPKMIYEITMSYEVPEKTVKDRLALLTELYEDMIVTDKEVKFS